LFFFNAPATTEFYTLSLHDALPISGSVPLDCSLARMTNTGSPGYHPMPQGQAVDVRERQFVVQLKEYFDQERRQGPTVSTQDARSEEHTSELQSLAYLVCRLLLEKK